MLKDVGNNVQEIVVIYGYVSHFINNEDNVWAIFSKKLSVG